MRRPRMRTAGERLLDDRLLAVEVVPGAIKLEAKCGRWTSQYSSSG